MTGKVELDTNNRDYMRIKLHDFGCYKDKTFEFGREDSMVLLSGPSGAGKTTIIRAIFFALFGEGKKLPTHGKKSCTVELDFGDLKIFRSKAPNRLVINDVYEDEAAQQIINKRFGDTFKTSGYIQQNMMSSFLMMPANEKLSFLEKFGFQDADPDKIKTKCKIYIAKCRDNHLSKVTQLDMTKNILDDLDLPSEVKFPIKCTEKNRQMIIKNEHTRYKNSLTRYERANKNKRKYEKEINALGILEATLQSRKEVRDNSVVKLEKIKDEIDEQDFEGLEKLKEYEKRLESLLAKRELILLEEQLDDNLLRLEQMKKEEQNDIQKELDNIQESIWKEYDQIEVKNNIAELKACLIDLETVKRLQAVVDNCGVDLESHDKHKLELENYIQQLDSSQLLYNKINIETESYVCPCCNERLHIVDNKLQVIENETCEMDDDIDLADLENKIAGYKNIINKLQRIIPVEEEKLKNKLESEEEMNKILRSYEDTPTIQEVTEDLDYLREYYASQMELEKKIGKLKRKKDSEQFSSSYESFKRNVDQLQEQVNSLQEKGCVEEDDMNEEELRNKIIEQKYIKNKIQELVKQQENLEDEINNYTGILESARKEHIEIYGSIRDEDDLTEKINQETKNIEEQEAKRKEHEANLKQIEDWEKYQKELDNYHSWEVKVENLEKEEKQARNEYAASTELKDKIIEAEAVALGNLIESINTHARGYLDNFFPDHPILVELQPFKETKNNTKPQININIEYKGMEADLSMLSGGELSRVNLAYTIALAEMFNIPLLLLDECTASLDEDLTNTVFETIRESFNGKITLIIAHQIIKGQFDKVINLT